jgi:hypothetical protein
MQVKLPSWQTKIANGRKQKTASRNTDDLQQSQPEERDQSAMCHCRTIRFLNVTTSESVAADPTLSFLPYF